MSWCCAVGCGGLVTHPASFVFGGAPFVSGLCFIWLQGTFDRNEGRYFMMRHQKLICFYRPGVRREVTTGLAED